MKLGYVYAGKVKGTLELGVDPYVGVGLWNASHIIVPGRIVSGTLAGAYITLPATYLFGELIEIRAQVTSWAGIGNEFKILYTRLSANLTNALGYLQGVSFISRVEEGIDLYGIRSAIFEVNLRAGGQSIDWVRGAEICINSATPDDVTVNITHFKILQIETQLNSDVAPTNENVGLWFEYDSAAAASITNWHDIRLAAGPRIFSHAGVPNGAIDPWLSAPIGSLCLRSDPTDCETVIYWKKTDDGDAGDWCKLTAAGVEQWA